MCITSYIQYSVGVVELKISVFVNFIPLQYDLFKFLWKVHTINKKGYQIGKKEYVFV